VIGTKVPGARHSLPRFQPTSGTRNPEEEP
jgi:hypothetical protein